MAKRKAKKEKTYVCVVCKKTKKAARPGACCSVQMTAQEKGTWNV